METRQKVFNVFHAKRTNCFYIGEEICVKTTTTLMMENPFDKIFRTFRIAMNEEGLESKRRESDEELMMLITSEFMLVEFSD